MKIWLKKNYLRKMKKGKNNMQPIPCAHCGFNFMRQNTDPEAPKLCNTCTIREEIRSPKKKDTMKTIDIVIKCPVDIQADVEELCINQGIDFSSYFITLHKKFKEKTGIFADFMKPIVESNNLESIEIKPVSNRGKKK